MAVRLTIRAIEMPNGGMRRALFLIKEAVCIVKTFFSTAFESAGFDR